MSSTGRARGRALATDGHWLSDWLWPQWAGPLRPAGATPGFVTSVVAGYHQELWLWLMGERTWHHTVTGLAGRIRRRIPAPANPPRNERGESPS